MWNGKESGENKANSINVPTRDSDKLNNSSPLLGTYATVLKSRTRTSVQVGWGTLCMYPDFYVYVGSALEVLSVQ